MLFLDILQTERWWHCLERAWWQVTTVYSGESQVYSGVQERDKSQVAGSQIPLFSLRRLAPPTSFKSNPADPQFHNSTSHLFQIKPHGYTIPSLDPDRWKPLKTNGQTVEKNYKAQKMHKSGKLWVKKVENFHIFLFLISYEINFQKFDFSAQFLVGHTNAIGENIPSKSGYRSGRFLVCYKTSNCRLKMSQ